MLGLADMPGPSSHASVDQMYPTDWLWTWAFEPLNDLPIASVFRSIREGGSHAHDRDRPEYQRGTQGRGG